MQGFRKKTSAMLCAEPKSETNSAAGGRLRLPDVPGQAIGRPRRRPRRQRHPPGAAALSA